MTKSKDPPPPEPPTELQMKRSKLLWRVVLVSNLALAAFLFGSVKRKDPAEKRTSQKSHKEKAIVEERPPEPEPEPEPEPDTNSLDFNYDDFIFPPTTLPVEVRAPISDDQQREVFTWMLEEKRKVKPKDRQEKKRNDEEKAILKQFLRAKTIPKF